ncbi:MAG: DUF4857 domain-containing protein [Candidatus Symbiothrix sp.]|jgi:hypothetical protein|nr:DUF4857 domain-containing protein [Candidatus Symbiothrix sp.]
MMKNKESIYILVLLFVTLVALWGIPELVKTATYSNDRYPFVYFSSTEKKLLFKEFDGREDALHDDEGKVYTDKEYDAALPLLNFRQLTVNGEMPDSIDGIAIDPRELRVKQVNFRYGPLNKNTPNPGLYIMYESLPKKAKLESPGDLFRLKNKIEFIDAASNRVNKQKSEQFQTALLKAGYAFPAQWTSGNLNIRKPYDEGYFSLDAQGQLYHIKMVNGRPFIKNTQLDSQIEPAFFAMEEVADKRFYGFLFDKKGNSYILEEDGGKYKTVQLDIDPIHLDADELMIIGNFLYWTVAVQTDKEKHFYALQTETLKRVRYAFVEAKVNKWEDISGKIFPFYLTFRDKHSEYIAPHLHFTAFTAWIANVLLAVLSLFIFHRKSNKKKIFIGIYTLIFGIAGLVALLIMGSSTSRKSPL